MVRWGLAVLALAALLYLYFAFLHPHRRVPAHPFFDGPARPLVIAHRGGGGLWPENTLLAFERALAVGADVLEMDLRTTADGHIVVIHDENVDRTTDGEGRVRDLTLDAIRELDAGHRFRDQKGHFPYRGKGLRVPILAEVLERFVDARLNLEMKEFSPEAARKLCRELRKFGATERSLVASFQSPPMVALRNACSEVATAATVREGFFFYYLHRLHLGSLYRSPAVALEVPEHFGRIHVIQPGFVESAHAKKLRVLVFTVDETAEMKRFLSLGVDGIATNYPTRLVDVMNRL